MTRELPKGWRRVRLKRMFSYAKGLNITKADLVDDGVAVVSYGQIHAKHNTGTHLDPSLIRYVPEEITAACPNSKLKKGDVVFADTSEDLEGVGNCVLNDSDGEVYAGYHALIASARFPEHSKYLSYLFQTDAWRGQIRTRASGIKVFSLTQRVLNPVTVILPPLPEQKRIAAFLDAKCADIAAASVLAKVTRDRYMLQMAEQYPQYGFEQHKGYGTKQHYAALLQYGPSPIHRMSFLKKLYG